MRLDKLSNNCRPNRATLPNQHDVFDVLKNKRKLNEFANFKYIGISSVRTLLQRKHLKNSIGELNAIEKLQVKFFCSLNILMIYLSSQKPNINSNKLYFYYKNVHGINTKLDVFAHNITLADYDIIVLSETWLRDEVNDCEHLSLS